MREHLGGQPDQGVDVEPARRAGARSLQRRKLQRAHAAGAGVAKPLDGVEALGRAALRRQPGVDAGMRRVGIGQTRGTRQATRQHTRKQVVAPRHVVNRMAAAPRVAATG